MNDSKKTKAQLIEELSALRQELEDVKSDSSASPDKNPDELLHLLLSALPGSAIAFFDREMRYLVIDGPEIKAVGFKRENVGRTLQECHSDEIIKIFEPIYHEVLNGNTFHFELGHDGKIFSEKIVPALDSSGYITGGIVIVTNISEKIRKDNQIRESQGRFKLALNGAELAFWDWNVRTAELAFNSRWAEMIGYKYEELDKDYSTWENLIHTNDKSATFKKLDEHLRRNSPLYESEFRMQTKDGEWKWIFARGKVMEWDAKGKPVRMAGTHLDITDSKHAQLKLAESEEKHRLLINSTKNIIWSLDEDFRFTFLSPIVHTILGYKPEEMLELSPWNFCYHEDQDLMKKIIVAIKEKITRNEKLHPYDNFEIRFQSKNGDIVWLDIKVGIFINDRGIFEGLIGTSADITAKKIAEQERENLIKELKASEKIIKENSRGLKKANTDLLNSEFKLKEAIQTKDRFFSIIAHDLKGPFYGFLSLAKSMAENFSDFRIDEIREMSKSLYGSANHLYRLLENLLEWSRTQIGSINMEPALIVLHDFIFVNVSIFKITAAQKNIEFKIDIQSDAYADADYRMTETILRNLMSNALKFTPEGGTISISAKTVNDIIEISVEDTGVGMSKKAMLDLFQIDKVKSTVGTNNEEGTGLGLIICKEFIVKHKNSKGAGVLSVESKPDNGTKFTFTLPKYEDEID
jgi:PAS domain S-box-containing protein